MVLMLFVIAWKAPDPPLGEIGVDLNIGLDFEGSGDVQPEEPIGDNQPKTEQKEEVQPEVKPEKPVEDVEEKPVVKADEEEILTSKDEESPAVIKETKKEDVKPKEVVKPVEKPKEKVLEKPIAVYKPGNASKAEEKSTTTTGKEGKPGSQGDDINKTGDKGDPRGTVDGKAMYGKPGNGGGGGGNGSSLEISGWEWDAEPSPTVPANESGRIVFEIKVDDGGDIISIKKLDGSVSAAAEQNCRKAIEKLTFTKIGANVPSISTGRITFVIRSK